MVAAADVLLKPTREDNPWGRDILEAMAQAEPGATAAGAGTEPGSGPQGKPDENVVDADFEEVDDQKKRGSA